MTADVQLCLDQTFVFVPFYRALGSTGAPNTGWEGRRFVHRNGLLDKLSFITISLFHPRLMWFNLNTSYPSLQSKCLSLIFKTPGFSPNLPFGGFFHVPCALAKWGFFMLPHLWAPAAVSSPWNAFLFELPHQDPAILPVLTKSSLILPFRSLQVNTLCIQLALQ